MAQPSYVENISSMPSPIALLQMASSYWVSKAIHAVAFLGIADLLQGGPKSSVELAHSTRVDAQSLHRLLRVTASVGVFAENREGNFELTPLANYLRTGVPGSVRELTIMLGEDWKWQSWGELLYSVKTGKPAFEHVFGMGLFTYLAQNTEAGELFNQAMGNFTAQQASAVVNAYDFSQFARVVDVAGGNGTLLLAILKANPQLSGVLFDQPAVIKDALKHIESAGLAERCETVAGDFSRVVPQGGDAYLIKQAIHNWDDERAIKILQNCDRAMTLYLTQIQGYNALQIGQVPAWVGLPQLFIRRLGMRETQSLQSWEASDSGGFNRRVLSIVLLILTYFARLIVIF